MSTQDFSTFRDAALADGFDEVVERRWDPGLVLATHQHPFALRAVVVSGEFWLTVADHVRHLRAGEHFALDRNVPHSERYGAEGATFWVARRHGHGTKAA